jgi:DNA-binding helix-hairpin-helix protein with protein kinase domain
MSELVKFKKKINKQNQVWLCRSEEEKHTHKLNESSRTVGKNINIFKNHAKEKFVTLSCTNEQLQKKKKALDLQFYVS